MHKKQIDTKIPMDTKTRIDTEDTKDIKDMNVTDETNELQDTYETQDIKDAQNELPNGKITSLVNDLEGFDANQATELSEMIQRCLPTSSGRLHKQVFHLARGLKSLPFLSDYCEKDCKLLVKLWHGLSLPFLSRKSFDDTWGEFCAGWGNIKIPLDKDFIEVCFKEAESLSSPELDSQYDTPETICILKLCYVMQKNSSKDYFFLACRKCGDVCGLNYQLVNKRLKALEVDGWLELVKLGNLKDRVANEYRFVGKLHGT